MQALYVIQLSHRPVRYNALKRLLVPISFKTLNNTLRELEADSFWCLTLTNFHVTLLGNRG